MRREGIWGVLGWRGEEEEELPPRFLLQLLFFAPHCPAGGVPQKDLADLLTPPLASFA